MKTYPRFRSADVQAVYAGPEGRLWELLMGEQIHIGGFQSSMDLAERARIAPDSHGIDLCCASGAGMRFLVRFRKVASMIGVDMTSEMLELAQRRCQEEGLSRQITFLEAEVCNTRLPAGECDFVWGEDAWCYVENKAGLVKEAIRLLKPGGTIAFTDWMEGTSELSAAEAEHFLGFMKFPNLLQLDEYASALKAAGATVRVAMNTNRFAPYAQLYLDMVEKQLTYDALRILGFDQTLAGPLVEELHFLRNLAKEGKIIQGLIVAQLV